MNDAHLSSQPSALTQEWVTLQNNHEQYERSALLIKIVATLLFAVGVAWPHGGTLHGSLFFGILCFVIVILWAQEAILRTSQARLGERLLRIESLTRNADTQAGHALQLHSEWLAQRAGFLGLLGEYARHALRPTIAFPYALFTALLGVLILCH